MAQGAGAMAEKARAAGTYGTAAADAGIMSGAALIGALEKFGLDHLFGRFAPEVRNRLLRSALGGFQGAVSEGVSEGAEGLGQNVIAKSLYAPNLDITDGIYDDAKTGAIVGGLVRALLGALPGRYHEAVTREMGVKAADDGAAAFTELGWIGGGEPRRWRAPLRRWRRF